MRGWPSIEDPQLRARLGLSDEAFLAFITRMVQSFGAREFSDAVYEYALAYPWSRPPGSYVLAGERATPLGDSRPAGERATPLGDSQAAGERATPLGDSLAASGGAYRRPAGTGPRYPLLAFGSNGSPATLARKLADLPGDERDLLAVAGELHDFDIGAAPLPAYYGSLPATLFPSPGAAVRASVLWVTALQLTALARTELSYFLGHLDGVRFEPESPEAEPITSVLAFVSRWGALCIYDEIVAMAAVPACRRAAAALTQEQLLDHVAGIMLGRSASARDLVRRIMEDFATTGTAIATSFGGTTRHFECGHWTRYVPPER